MAYRDKQKSKDWRDRNKENRRIYNESCPILHIKLTHDGNRDHSPSLDRIIPQKGYVKGNVQVISLRANRIKSDATLEELERIVENLRSHLCPAVQSTTLLE